MSSEGDGVCEVDVSSDVSHISEDNQMFTAEYKNCHLQIVEVTPFDKKVEHMTEGYGQGNYRPEYREQILPHSEGSSDDGDTKYLQIMDSDKGMVQLDLLNFTLVKCGDGSNTYQMVSNSAASDDDTTITCVLSDDVDDNQDSSYVMVTEDDTDPYIYLRAPSGGPPPHEHPPAHAPQTTATQSHNTEQLRPALTPIQILEKAKKLQKAKALLRSVTKKSTRGRKRSSELPPPMELLASPNFKLYLYNCKMCSYKCNAIKDMSAHKAAEHPGGGGGGRGGAGAGAASLQCARCPFRGNTHTQLMKHVREYHTKEQAKATERIATTVRLDSSELSAADVLVCGACGFESGDRTLFKKHIEDDHGATTTI